MKTTILLFLMALPACAMQPYLIGPVSSQPNVLIAQRNRPLQISFAPEIPLVLPVTNHPGPNVMMAPVRLERWQDTLSNGFHAGFDRFSGKDGTPEQLVLLKTEVVVYSELHFSSEIDLTYQAELRDGNVVVKRFAGTVRIMPTSKPPESVSRLVSAMYEQIGQQMNG